MANVGTVMATAGLNMSGFTRGIKDMHKQGARVAKDIQQSFDKIGRGMQSVGRKMTLGISAPLLGAGALAVKTAADYEKLRTSMDILNGSVEEGARNFERLKEFSARTPFQLGDLAKAQNMLQGFGQSADDAFESIRMIGDIAAVSGGSIEGIGIAFGQASAEGMLMSRDIRQLVNQGVPAIKLLADTMGVAQSEIFDLASQGEISFDILQQAFRDATSEGGMFADGMAKQSKTIAGLFSTLKDNVSIALGEVGNTLSEELDIRGIIASLTENIQRGVKWFGSLSVEAKKMGIAIAGIAIVSGPTLLVLGSLARAMSSVLIIAPKLATAIRGLTAVMIANPYLAVGAAILGIATHVFLANKRLSRMGSLVRDVLDMPISGTREEIDKINDAIDSQMSIIKNVISQHKTMGIIGTEASEKQLQPMRDVLQALLDQREETAKLMRDQGKVSEAVVESTKKQSEASNTSATVMIDNIRGVTGEYVSLVSVIDQVRQAMAKPVKAFADIAQDRTAEGMGQVQFDGEKLPQAMRDSMQRLQDIAKNKFDIVSGIANDFTASFGSGMANVVVQGEKLVDTLKNIGKLLLSSAIQKGLSILLSGGLAGGGFFGSKGGLFGAIFGGQKHSGGMITGSGERMIRAKGGEMVLTPSQQNALGGMIGGNNTTISSKSMSMAFEQALDRKLRKLTSEEIFVLAQKGSRSYA